MVTGEDAEAEGVQVDVHTLGFQKLVPVGVRRACVLTDRKWGLVGENARPAVFPFDVKGERGGT